MGRGLHSQVFVGIAGSISVQDVKCGILYVTKILVAICCGITGCGFHLALQNQQFTMSYVFTYTVAFLR